MTREQAQHVATLIQIVNIAQEKGALKLGDAKAAIIAIDGIAPEVSSILNASNEPAAVEALA
jgi:hypothetical protein